MALTGADVGDDPQPAPVSRGSRGLLYRGAVFVSDLRHFLDMPDDAPSTAKRLGLQLAAIVRAASARPISSGARSAIGCTRRPGRRPCEGFVMVFRRTNGEVAWSCDACGDEGVIHGWEGSRADVSGLDDSYAEGDTVALLIPRDLSELIRDALLLDDACELLVARVEARSDGAVHRAGARRSSSDASGVRSLIRHRRRRRSGTGTRTCCSGGRRSPCSSTPPRFCR